MNAVGVGQELSSEGMADLVIPFDPRRYNEQATIAENLLFGVPTVPELTGRNLASEPRFRAALDKLFLLDDLARMGSARAGRRSDSLSNAS